MLLFYCETCSCVDLVELAYGSMPPAPPQPFQCTECQTGLWHNQFPKQQFDPQRDNVVNRPTGIGLG